MCIYVYKVRISPLTHRLHLATFGFAMEEEKPAPTEAPPPAEEEEPKQQKPSLFPLFPASDASSSQPQRPSVPQWLNNSSFTADLSLITDAVFNVNPASLSSPPEPETDSEQEEEPQEKRFKSNPKPSYELLESSSESDRATRKESTEKRTKRRKKRKRKKSRERGGLDDYHRARKSDVRAWAGSETKPSKDCYFDSRGDPDNLAFGCLYRYSPLISLHIFLKFAGFRACF
jgi:hypothetical protein